VTANPLKREERKKNATRATAKKSRSGERAPLGGRFSFMM
jgi:hypothetical protein